MNRQDTHPKFLFFAKNSTSPLTLNALLQTNGTWLMCISLSNKNVLTCKELTEQQAFSFKLLNWDAMLCRILKRMASDASRGTVFDYIAFSAPTGLSPKLSSPQKGPFTIVQCLNDVTYKMKSTANQKQTIVHYVHLKPFIQRSEEPQLPRRKQSLSRVPESKSAHKPHFAFQQHCNRIQTLSDQIPPSPLSWSASPAPFSPVIFPETPIQGCSAANQKRAYSVPGRTTVCSPLQDLSQVSSHNVQV